MLNISVAQHLDDCNKLSDSIHVFWAVDPQESSALPQLAELSTVGHHERVV